MIGNFGVLEQANEAEIECESVIRRISTSSLESENMVHRSSDAFRLSSRDQRVIAQLLSGKGRNKSKERRLIAAHFRSRFSFEEIRHRRRITSGSLPFKLKVRN